MRNPRSVGGWGRWGRNLFPHTPHTSHTSSSPYTPHTMSEKSEIGIQVLWRGQLKLRYLCVRVASGRER
ncbi:MAG: hypothetical protein PUP90_21400 [Nostoc sp. S4]|nr:hypothetical protein [Nostoc sp. S4]